MLRFDWDRERHRLKRDPESSVCTQAENIQASRWLLDIETGDRITRESAEYSMALLGYEMRGHYEPCRVLVGGRGPVWMEAPAPSVYAEVRDGLHRIASLIGQPDKLRKAAVEEIQVQKALAFQEYVHRVSTIESYNESCCKTLLWTSATLERLNPEGDAAAIQTLNGMLADWYGIHHPADTHDGRSAQAARASHNPRWLSNSWRAVWSKP